MRRTLFACVSIAALAIAVLPACAGGSVASSVRPADPTYASTVASAAPAASESCAVVESHGEPLVVDWRPELRADLEVAMLEGVAIVHYDCRGLRVLKDCAVPGEYGFLGMNKKAQVVRLENGDEIRANLPLTGSKVAVSLEGEMKRGATLDVALVMVGKKTTTRSSLAKNELHGRCDGATHFLRRATVGSFAVSTGTRADLRSAAQIFGASANAASGSAKGITNQDGDLAACDKATSDATKAPPNCSALVRIELIAVDATKEPDDALPATCPRGTVASAGKCAAPSADVAHQCAPDDTNDCVAQCDRGDAGSCYNLGVMAEHGRVVPVDLARAAMLFGKACDAGSAEACSALAWVFARGSGVPKDYARAFALTKRACDDGNAHGCSTLGVLYTEGWGVAKDEARAAALSKSACDGGYPLGCSNLGSRYKLGTGVAKDIAKALALFTRACEAHVPGGCVNLGVMLREGEGVAKDAAHAEELFRGACDAGLSEGCAYLGDGYLEGEGVSKDVSRARELYEKACTLGGPYGCGQLGALYEKGIGVAKDAKRAKELLDGACSRGNAWACKESAGLAK